MTITVCRNTLGGTIAPGSRHDPPPEGPAPTPEQRRTPRTQPTAPVFHGPRRPSHPRRRSPAGQRGTRLSGRRPGGRPQERRRRLPPGRPLHREGLAALQPRHGGGREATYDAAARDRILREVARTPTPERDGTATWSLSTLRRVLRSAPDGLARVSTSTLWRVLHEAGYSPQQTRTWCPTGSALRRRQAGTVTVTDPDAEPKKRRS